MLNLLYKILISEPNKYLVKDYEKLYEINNDVIMSSFLNEKLTNSIEIFREVVLGL